MNVVSLYHQQCYIKSYLAHPIKVRKWRYAGLVYSSKYWIINEDTGQSLEYALTFLWNCR